MTYVAQVAIGITLVAIEYHHHSIAQTHAETNALAHAVLIDVGDAHLVNDELDAVVLVSSQGVSRASRHRYGH